MGAGAGRYGSVLSGTLEMMEGARTQGSRDPGMETRQDDGPRHHSPGAYEPVVSKGNSV